MNKILINNMHKILIITTVSEHNFFITSIESSNDHNDRDQLSTAKALNLENLP